MLVHGIEVVVAPGRFYPFARREECATEAHIVVEGALVVGLEGAVLDVDGSLAAHGQPDAHDGGGGRVVEALQIREGEVVVPFTFAG